jgi:hypothetical protein
MSNQTFKQGKNASSGRQRVFKTPAWVGPVADAGTFGSGSQNQIRMLSRRFATALNFSSARGFFLIHDLSRSAILDLIFWAKHQTGSVRSSAEKSPVGAARVIYELHRHGIYW